MKRRAFLKAILSTAVASQVPQVLAKPETDVFSYEPVDTDDLVKADFNAWVNGEVDISSYESSATTYADASPNHIRLVKFERMINTGDSDRVLMVFAKKGCKRITKHAVVSGCQKAVLKNTGSEMLYQVVKKTKEAIREYAYIEYGPYVETKKGSKLMAEYMDKHYRAIVDKCDLNCPRLEG